MNKFIEIPASKISTSKRKLVCGVGVNDADYLVLVSRDGKITRCPIYSTWSSMITRCHSKKFRMSNPTYADCSISNDWLTFSNFRAWMVNQDWQGKALDKDIIHNGNKVYSDETCIFVSSAINKLLNSNRAIGGACSTGVTLDKGKYKAQCNIDGKRVHVGYFNTDKEAAEAFLSFKSRQVLKIANEQEEPLKGYLTRISKEIAGGDYF